MINIPTMGRDRGLSASLFPAAVMCELRKMTEHWYFQSSIVTLVIEGSYWELTEETIFWGEFPSRDRISSLVCNKPRVFEWLSDLGERENNFSVVKYCKGNNQSPSEPVFFLLFIGANSKVAQIKCVRSNLSAWYFKSNGTVSTKTPGCF